MPRETWAVHSVRDHLAPYPFVVDCLLYDRVRVPVPADDDRDRWVQREWDPARLDRFTQVLGDRARTLEWDAELRNQWRSSYLAAQRSAQDTAPDAFKMTRTIVVDSLPRDVTGVDTVSAYTDFADMRADAGRYRKNRRAYWRWVREFTAGNGHRRRGPSRRPQRVARPRAGPEGSRPLSVGRPVGADGLPARNGDPRDRGHAVDAGRRRRSRASPRPVRLDRTMEPPAGRTGRHAGRGHVLYHRRADPQADLRRTRLIRSGSGQVGGGGTGQDVVVGIGQPAAVVGQHDIVERTRHVGLGVIDGHSSLF